MKNLQLPGLDGELLINEDGTEIIWQENGQQKVLKQYLIKAPNHAHGFHQIYVKHKKAYVHHLVAQAYVHNPKPISYKMVLHLDSNSLNNHYSNLQWGDRKMLQEIRIKAGFTAKTKEFRGRSKISYEEAVKIAKRLDNGEHASDICKEYGVSNMSIIRIRKRYSERKSISPRYEKEIKEVVLKFSETKSIKEISDITGLKYRTVYNWIKKVI